MSGIDTRTPAAGTSTPDPARTGAPDRDSASTTLAWVSSALSALVVSANLSVMSVAFDSLRRDFPGTQLSVLGWVLSIYTIVFGAFLVPAGRVADRIGRRTVFMWGLGIFGVASLVGGFAPTIEVVIAGRVGQGVGAACLVPSTLGLLLDALPPGRRASATAFYSVVASLGGVAGPTVGAVLVDQAGWRGAFFVAPVFALGSWVTGRRSLPESRGRTGAGLPDGLGALLVVVGLSAVSFGIVESRDWGWADARIVGAFVLGAATVPAFVHRCRTHPVPILPLPLTRFRSFTFANVASALYGMSTGALLFSSVLFLREVWGYSILKAGAGILPLSIMSTASSLVVGRLAARFGERAVGVPACAIVGGGMVLAAWRMGATPSFVGEWIPAFGLIGLGMGLAYPMIGAACVRDVDAADLSVASASNRTTLQIGNAIGIALVIAILGDAKGADALHQMRVSWVVLAALALTVSASMAGIGRPPARETPAGGPPPAVP